MYVWNEILCMKYYVLLFRKVKTEKYDEKYYSYLKSNNNNKQ